LGEDFRQVDYIKFKLRVDLVGDYRSGEILFGESCRFVSKAINGKVGFLMGGPTEPGVTWRRLKG